MAIFRILLPIIVMMMPPPAAAETDYGELLFGDPSELDMAADFATCGAFYRVYGEFMAKGVPGGENAPWLAEWLDGMSNGARLAGAWLLMLQSGAQGQPVDRDNAIEWINGVTNAEAIRWRAMVFDGDIVGEHLDAQMDKCTAMSDVQAILIDQLRTMKLRGE